MRNIIIKRFLKSSPLENLHIKAEGQLGNFHGWNLPMQYTGHKIKDSAKHCRQNASLFDVSHMLQTRISGDNALRLIENLTPLDAANLDANTGSLTIFTMKNGGIQDDLIVNKLNDDNTFYVVSNCARADVDLPYMQKEASRLGNVTMEIVENSLVALQGPKAEKILQELVDVDLSKIHFMQGFSSKINGTNCRITRCGYTGEDGFEISCDSPKSVEKIMENVDIKWAGLAERDILRLEGGMCLYGNDLTEATTPYSARLMWLVNKRRRNDCVFPGAEIILNELENKRPNSGVFRVGLTKTSAGRALRAGMDVYDEEMARKIGTVTSGSPSVNVSGVESVAQAYILQGEHQNGKTVVIAPKGKKPNAKHSAQISRMPFIETKYKVQK